MSGEKGAPRHIAVPNLLTCLMLLLLSTEERETDRHIAIPLALDSLDIARNSPPSSPPNLAEKCEGAHDRLRPELHIVLRKVPLAVRFSQLV